MVIGLARTKCVSGSTYGRPPKRERIMPDLSDACFPELECLKCLFSRIKIFEFQPGLKYLNSRFFYVENNNLPCKKKNYWENRTIQHFYLRCPFRAMVISLFFGGAWQVFQLVKRDFPLPLQILFRDSTNIQIQNHANTFFQLTTDLLLVWRLMRRFVMVGPSSLDQGLELYPEDQLLLALYQHPQVIFLHCTPNAFLF